MEIIYSLIFVTTAIVFFFGQLWRVSLGSITFPLIDIFLIILAIINIAYRLVNKDKNKLSSSSLYFLIFLFWTSFSLALNFIISPFALIKPLFYLLRLMTLLSFFIFPLPKLSPFYLRLITSIFVALVIFCLLQYCLWPNFTYFSSLGWDPHLNRIVGLYFDPTFTALILLFFLVYLYFHSLSNLKLNYFLLALTYLALALTYSRSSFLAFVVAFIFISLKKRNIRPFLFSVLLMAATIFLLPQPYGEGTKLARTSSIKAKIENYQQGLTLFTVSPLIGLGYNRLESFKPQNQSSLTTNHAAAGFDSSLLTLAITTGIIGLCLFSLAGWLFFVSQNLFGQTLLITWLVHSAFANSLLYPFVVFAFLALTLKNHK